MHTEIDLDYIFSDSRNYSVFSIYNILNDVFNYYYVNVTHIINIVHHLIIITKCGENLISHISDF